MVGELGHVIAKKKIEGIRFVQHEEDETLGEILAKLEGQLERRQHWMLLNS